MIPVVAPQYHDFVIENVGLATFRSAFVRGWAPQFRHNGGAGCERSTADAQRTMWVTGSLGELR